MSRSPHFFCENCGTEVPRKAVRCPGCGRLFSSVRCPKCAFTGSEHLFSDGCPSCGYSSAGPDRATGERAGSAPFVRKDGLRGTARPENVGALPLWVYLVTAFALVAVAVAAVLVLR